MRLDCKITDRIKADFSALWRCEHHGNTLEISTPYRMPDSTLFKLFMTERGDRLIACDGGSIWELIRERCGLAEESALMELQAMADENQIKVGRDHRGPIFYKDCRDENSISSISFDVVNFAVLVSNVMISLGADEIEEKEQTKRFNTTAQEYIQNLLRPDQRLLPHHSISGVPDVKFSAVIESRSRLVIVSYIGGSDVSQFRKNAGDTALNFKEAWASSTGVRINRTIPILNDGARGYDPSKIASRLLELKHLSKQEPITWTERDQLKPLLAA